MQRRSGESDGEHLTVPRGDGPVVIVEPEVDDPVRVTPLHREPQFEPSKLPIDDEDYVPSHGDELGRALRQLFADTPDEASPWVWRQALRISNKLADSDENDGDGEDEMNTQQGTQDTQAEAVVRSVVRRIMNEAPRRRRSTFDRTEPDAVTPRQVDRWGDVAEPTATIGLSDADAALLASIDIGDDVDPADRAADEEEEEIVRRAKYNTAGEEGMTLAAIAEKLGMAGPSGVKNLLNRVEDKLKYFAGLDEIWFRDLMENLALAYIDELEDVLRKDDALTPDDEEFFAELRDDPDEVLQSEKFREWSKSFLADIYNAKSGKPAR